MKKSIVKILEQMEETYEIKILFACEAGSRAWGLGSEKSDYDVRFIYIHPTDVYLRIDPIGTKNNRDVIEAQEHAQLDIHGWELTKALRLLRKSNPSLSEWLRSPIVYYKVSSTADNMRNLFSQILNQKACMIHYVNMAKKNMNQLERKDSNIKTVINIIRPLLVARWIEKNNQFPPMDFKLLSETLLPSGVVQKEVHKLIQQKVISENNYLINHFDNLISYAESEITQLDATIEQLENPTNIHVTERLNAIFRNALYELRM